MATTKVAAAQIGADLDQVEANVRRVVGAIDDAAAQGVQLVVLPETVLNGYMFEDLESVCQSALALEGPELTAIVEACRRGGIIAVVGLLEAADDVVYNTAVLVGPDGLIGSYRKQHLPCLGLDRFVTAGQQAHPAVFDTPIGRVGLAICYDIRFPESARCLALAGADIIVQPSVWPDTVDIIANHMVRVRAAENHVFLVAVTRGDKEAGIQFRGNSQIIDPRGNVLAWAGQGDALITADVDLSFSAQKRIVVRPGKYEVSLFQDRRPASYAGITSATGPDGLVADAERCPQHEPV